MLALKYDGDITRSPDFWLRGRAIIEIVTRMGYVVADETDCWLSEADLIASMLDDDAIQGDESLARKTGPCTTRISVVLTGRNA